MENTQHKKSVCEVLGGCCCSVLSFFGRLVRLVYKYKYLFLVFAVLAAVSCLFFARDRKQVADTHLLLNDGDYFLYENLVKQLNAYAERGDVEGLAAAMNTTDEVAAKICGFETFRVIDIHRDGAADFVDYGREVSLGDTVNAVVPNQMVLRVKLRKLDACAEVQKGLMSYFSGNGYLSSLNISRLSSLEEREWMFHNALLNVDSLQKVDFFQNKAGYVSEFASQNEPYKPFVSTKKQMYYEDMQRLFDLNESIAVDLSTNLEVVTVMSDLQPQCGFDKPMCGIVWRSIIIALLAFWVVAFFWDERKKVSEYMNR